MEAEQKEIKILQKKTIEYKVEKTNTYGARDIQQALDDGWQLAGFPAVSINTARQPLLRFAGEDAPNVAYEVVSNINRGEQYKAIGERLSDGWQLWGEEYFSGMILYQVMVKYE